MPHDDTESSAKGEKESGKEKYRYLGRMQRGCDPIPGDHGFSKDIQDVSAKPDLLPTKNLFLGAMGSREESSRVFRAGLSGVSCVFGSISSLFWVHLIHLKGRRSELISLFLVGAVLTEQAGSPGE